MSARNEIETAIRNGYAARVKGDVDGTLAMFHAQASFRISGRGTGVEAMHAERRGHLDIRAALAELITAFRFEDWTEVALLVDGERAALHWRARVVCTATGYLDQFDVVDLFTFKDGKAIELIQFFDTALAMKIAQPST